MRSRRFSISSLSLLLSFSIIISFSSAFQCGEQAGGAVCAGGLCCSKWGYCGTTTDYCGEGCQSQCEGGGGGGGGGECKDGTDEGLGNIITRSQFEEMLLQRNNQACPGRCFYTYDAFIEATKYFPEFGTAGDKDTQLREIAAFFGQTSHETTGGWATAPDGPYAWGYCFVSEVGAEAGASYCDPTSYPCASGKKYFGRGPIQLSWNYNYAQCGQALGLDLLNNPELVATDQVTTFKTALWFWMTPQAPKPSCHDVMIGKWEPSSADIAAGRLPGYGLTTNIINGGLECGFSGPDDRVENRIGFYKRYCDLLGVSYGDNLDCYSQRPFGSGLRLSKSV